MTEGILRYLTTFSKLKALLALAPATTPSPAVQGTTRSKAAAAMTLLLVAMGMT